MMITVFREDFTLLIKEKVLLTLRARMMLDIVFTMTYAVLLSEALSMKSVTEMSKCAITHYGQVLRGLTIALWSNCLFLMTKIYTGRACFTFGIYIL